MSLFGKEMFLSRNDKYHFLFGDERFPVGNDVGFYSALICFYSEMMCFCSGVVLFYSLMICFFWEMTCFCLGNIILVFVKDMFLFGADLFLF